ncbi:MAG: hypothetical protein C3F02_03080 [Parcubacteria group bacterium]|nr:MAG: hypothetical protein C3F02_03080 [Parcubacteria group bacterium]
MLKKGFTLLEIILVVAVLAITATIMIRAMNPARRMGEAWNSVRTTDVLAIQRAIQQYAIDNYGFPASLSSLAADTPYMIVKRGGSTSGTSACTSTEPIAKADILGDLATYLPAAIKDPTLSSDSNDTGYYIVKQGNSYAVNNCYSYVVPTIPVASTPAATVPSGVIVAWPSTNINIPSGWTRVTDLDAYYLEGTTANPSAVAGGNTTHTHTSATHTHTIAHTHTGTTGAASGTYDTAEGIGGAANAHTQTITTANASGSNVAASADLGAISNDPPYTEVIWIQSNGTAAGVPNGAWALFDSDTLPASWSRQSGNRFLKGAAASGNGGGTGGSANDHSHTDNGHTHTESAHTHTGTTGSASVGGSLISSTVAGGARTSHTHTISSGNQTATEVSGVGVLANGDGQPPFYKLNIIQNDTGSANYPNNIIAMWSGTTASIPSGWVLCDGNNGCPNLNDKFIKGANADSEINGTGGAATHTHSAGTGHTHTINSHSHSFTVSAGTSAKYELGGDADGTTIASQSHTHTLSVTGGGTTGSATVTADANTDNRPSYKEIVYIQYQGGVSRNEQGDQNRLVKFDFNSKIAGNTRQLSLAFNHLFVLAKSWSNLGLASLSKYDILAGEYNNISRFMTGLLSGLRWPGTNRLLAYLQFF